MSKFEAFTWDDPSGELPAEFDASPSPPGLLMYDGKGFNKLLMWSEIESFTGAEGASDEFMDYLTFKLSDGGHLVIEVESYPEVLEALEDDTSPLTEATVYSLAGM